MVTVRCDRRTFPNIEAIIFDKDGTLADSQAILRLLGQCRSRRLDARIPGTGESMLIAYGINGDRLDPSSLLAIGSRHENLIAAAAYVAETGRSWHESLQVAQEAFTEADQWLASNHPDTATSPLFVGSLELLAQLHQQGLQLGILSADTTARVEAFVDAHQLHPFISLKMGVDQGVSKPDPSLFITACDRLGVQPDRALMVGDSPLDIEMAQRAGAAGAIGIAWDWSTPSVPHLHAADVVIRRLDEIVVLKAIDNPTDLEEMGTN